MRFRTVIVVAGVLSLLSVSAGLAWGGDPPGNNGTVKVDGLPFGDRQGNEPHVSCVLQVDFYGFDEGPYTGTATFELLPPTGRGFLLGDSTFIGQDPAGGGNDLDASLTEDLSGAIALSGASPQAHQGFHIELTVHAGGSIGSDVKHKTLWVDSCGGEGGNEG